MPASISAVAFGPMRSAACERSPVRTSEPDGMTSFRFAGCHAASAVGRHWTLPPRSITFAESSTPVGVASAGADAAPGGVPVAVAPGDAASWAPWASATVPKASNIAATP